MKTWMTWGLVVLLGGLLIHLALFWAMPRAIMGVVFEQIETTEGSNRMFFPPRASFRSRDIPRPSPDLHYSVCLADLESGPVRLSVPVSEPYASVSVFAGNTDNVVTRNDRQADPDGVIRLTLTLPEMTGSTGSVDPVELSSPRALVLVRRVVTSDTHYRELDRLSRRASCRVMGQHPD